MTIRERAARALDATHGKEHVGIHTVETRLWLATYLDGTAYPARLMRKACAYLEMIARSH